MSYNNNMEPNLPLNNLEKISRFENAVFYCINEDGLKMPVGVVGNFSFAGDKLLEFTVNSFPVLEHCWNVFAAELHFHKKGLSFNMKLHGTAWFVNQDELTVQFKVLHTECFGKDEIKPYSLQESLTGFISSTGTFFKRMIVTGF